MEKVYLKFRLEVLPGNWLLFQVLEMDERFRAKGTEVENSLNINDGTEIISAGHTLLSNVHKAIYLRGSDKSLDYKPHSLQIKTDPDYAKKDILKALSQFWKWEGFKEDFKTQEIEQLVLNDSKSIKKETRYIFRANNTLLDYEIWERDKYVFLKVNHADDCLINVLFKDGYEQGAINDYPLIYENISFKGSVPEHDFNVVKTEKFRSPDIKRTNKQVIRFLNEHIQEIQTKKPELVDLGNNIYELRG